MVRTQTLPWESWADCTPGQISWVFLNQILDWDERKGNVHPGCLPKLETDYCEVCNEPLIGVGMRKGEMPEGVSEEDIYRPGEDMGELTEEEELELKKEQERFS